jgi:hypothetical protein
VAVDAVVVVLAGVGSVFCVEEEMELLRSVGRSRIEEMRSALWDRSKAFLRRSRGSSGTSSSLVDRRYLAAKDAVLDSREGRVSWRVAAL